MRSEAEVVADRLLAVTEGVLQRRAQLEAALVSRIAIEQAKGILAERYGLTIDEAFLVLRRAARSSQTKIHALAEDIVASTETPSPVRRAVVGHRKPAV